MGASKDEVRGLRAGSGDLQFGRQDLPTGEQDGRRNRVRVTDLAIKARQGQIEREPSRRAHKILASDTRDFPSIHENVDIDDVCAGDWRPQQ